MRIEPERNKSKYFTTRLLHRWYDYVEKVIYINLMLFIEKSRFFIFQLQFLLFLLLFYHKQMEEDWLDTLMIALDGYNFTSTPPEQAKNDHNIYCHFEGYEWEYCTELPNRVFKCYVCGNRPQLLSEKSIKEHQQAQHETLNQSPQTFDIKRFKQRNINIKLLKHGNEKKCGGMITKADAKFDGDSVTVDGYYIIIEEWISGKAIKKNKERCKDEETAVVPSKKQKPTLNNVTPPAYNPIYPFTIQHVKVARVMARFTELYQHGANDIINSLMISTHQDCTEIKIDIDIHGVSFTPQVYSWFYTFLKASYNALLKRNLMIPSEPLYLMFDAHMAPNYTFYDVVMHTLKNEIRMSAKLHCPFFLMHQIGNQ
jgi:hypothetical protein